MNLNSIAGMIIIGYLVWLFLAEVFFFKKRSKIKEKIKIGWSFLIGAFYIFIAIYSNQPGQFIAGGVWLFISGMNWFSYKMQGKTDKLFKEIEANRQLIALMEEDIRIAQRGGYVVRTFIKIEK